MIKRKVSVDRGASFAPSRENWIPSFARTDRALRGHDHAPPLFLQARARFSAAARRRRRGGLRAARGAGGRRRRASSTATNSRAGSTIRKNLPIDKREAIYAKLVKCSAWGVGIATVEEIDTINIYWARMLAMTRAVEALGLEPAWVLVDGNACPRWQRPSKAIVDGDAKCRSIAAASIIAKVTRDRIMADYARDYPGYGWEHNRGYGTPDASARARRRSA